jgi:hypothetical protein
MLNFDNSINNDKYLQFIEINKVRGNLFQINGVEKKPLSLPEADGPVISRQEKVYVPVEEHPEVSLNILF